MTRRIKLQPDPQRREIHDISILINLVHECLKYGLPDPSKAVEKVIRRLLIKERSLLKNAHIRNIYNLPNGNLLQKLVVQAVVQQFMKTNKTKHLEEPPDQSDDEEYLGEGRADERYWRVFRYEETLVTNEAFELDLLREMKLVDSQADIKPVFRGRKKMKNERAIWFSDPLR